MNETPKTERATPDQPAAEHARAPLPGESPRQVVIDILATAVTDLLLAEVEKAARGGSDELSTC